MNRKHCKTSYVPSIACTLLLAAVVHLQLAETDAADPQIPNGHIGYTEFRADLPGGRHANVITMRAKVSRLNDADRRDVAAELAQEPNSWTQFAGWSPDGEAAIIGAGWEDPENARWEEENRTFRYTDEGWLYDNYLVDLKSGTAENLTGVDRVSFHNSGLFFWPNDPTRLGFQALIDGQSRPFSMDRDGRNKVDLSSGTSGFAYGFGASPDGRRIAYHKDYQVYIANPDGSNPIHVVTGKPFNFAPKWSPDSRHVLFVAGEHYNCHPHIASADGTGLRQIGDRNGYRGVVEFLDVDDFHGGSSDIPVWSNDGQSVFFTSLVGESVELFRTSLDGKAERLTEGPAGTLHYHPTPGPYNDWIAFGSKRDGRRQLYVMHVPTRKQFAITDVGPGFGAMWPHWQPRATN